MTETTERFLQEIATRVGYDRVAELYLFPVLRQGGIEGAVAVVAAHPEPDGSVVDTNTVDTDTVDATAAEPLAAPADDAAENHAAANEQSDAADVAPEAAATQRPHRARHVVYTARYRHTVKGTDRGRWVVEVVAEADAPLITVEQVVRGVVRRSGDAFQPERISGDQLRALVRAPAAPESAPV